MGKGDGERDSNGGVGLSVESERDSRNSILGYQNICREGNRAVVVLHVGI